MRRSLVALAVLLAPLAATAADRAVPGKSFVLEEAPRGRVLAVKAVDPRSATAVVGDPTTPAVTSGGVLDVAVAGATPSGQRFVLPQGTAQDGKPFWRPLTPAGYDYVDRFAEHGPVRALRLRKHSNGTVSVAIKVQGAPAAVALVPPDPGTAADVTLALGDGDRYCLRFGPDGAVRNRDGRVFAVRQPASAGCPATVSGEFLALSYNVAGLPEGISGSHPAVNTAQIAPKLNAYDLVLMQETWKTPDPNPLAPLRVYHEILEAGADHPFKSISAPLPLNTDPSRPTAIVSDGLNQFSRFPFGAMTREPWAVCHESAADCLSLKGFSMARTTVAPGVTVDVYDLHMEAGSDPEDDVARDLGVTQLSTFIQTVSAGRPVIVGGDFNLHTDTEPDGSQFQRLLAETGLVDVCAALGCPQPGRIDKFLFRSNAAVTLTPLSWRFETDVFVDGAGDPLSDHDALAVRFAWQVVAP